MPQLAKIAMNCLTMLASSAPSERVFSAAGNLVTETRNKLDSATIEACILGHYLNRFMSKTTRD